MVPAGAEREEEKQPVLFGSLLGKACWFNKEKKGKEMIITHFFFLFLFFLFTVFPLCFQGVKVKIECQHFLCIYQVPSGKGTPGVSVDAPYSLLIPLLNSQRCWPTIASLCNELPQPSQTSDCVWEHQPRICVVMS